MKKTNSMRVAIVMLALALITSCFAGGTFAKYTTGKNATDSARVAKFGVTITATGSTFAKEYKTDNEDVVGTIANSVVSSTDKVVAPGTKGNMAAMTIAGQPEVAVTVAYKATFNLANWADESGAYYCPIEIKIGENTIKGTAFSSEADFKAAVENAINSTKNYPAGTDLSALAAPSVSWSWAFEGNDDAKDTYLGNQAALGNGATISLDVAATVTQID